jgi:hypothetical protein
MGFGIKKEAGSNSTPSEIVNFDKLTPTTAGVVFTPNTPATLDVLYLSSVDASTWIWNGTAYVTYTNTTASTEWYLFGTTIDAGSNKTAAISRDNSIYTVGYDSYFNSVRIGRGNGNIATNTVVGLGTGGAISTGSNNSFFGTNSGMFNSSGNFNSFFGTYAGYSTTTAGNNTFIGESSGYSNTIGTNNTFTGYQSGYNNTTAVDNTFVGKSSGLSTTTGGGNTANGVESLYSNTTGTSNIANGGASLYSNTTGGGNTSNGVESLYSSTTGFLNTANGYRAGRYIADGTTALTNVGNSVFLGADAKALANNQTNQIVIGYNAIGKGSNTVNIGNTSITDTYLQGAVTVNNAFTLPTTDGTANYFLKTNGSGTVTWAVAGLSFFSEAQATTGVNATVYANSLTAVSTTVSADFAIIPKGTGAILARVPDGVSTANNKRGQYAVDFQRVGYVNANEVASGQYSTILNGWGNKSTGIGSFAHGRVNNSGANYSFAFGDSTSATGAHSFAFGNGALATNGNAVAFNGNASGDTSFAFTGVASGQSAVSFQGSGASGYFCFATGSATTASGSFSSTYGTRSNTFSHSSRKSLGCLPYDASINASGYAQRSWLNVATNTTTATPKSLNAYNGTPTFALNLQNNNAMRVKGSIIGKQTGSVNVGAWDFDCVIVRGTTAATTVIAGTPTISLIVNTGGFGNPTLTANTTEGSLDIKVTGLAGISINWNGTIDSCETIIA